MLDRRATAHRGGRVRLDELCDAPYVAALRNFLFLGKVSPSDSAFHQSAAAHGSLNEALRAVMNDGAPLLANWPQLLVLMAWATVTFFFALRLFKWQWERMKDILKDEG
ncbi:MAG: ABC transporter permease [Pyrinomonadaceae bacterium]